MAELTILQTMAKGIMGANLNASLDEHGKSVDAHTINSDDATRYAQAAHDALITAGFRVVGPLKDTSTGANDA